MIVYFGGEKLMKHGLVLEGGGMRGLFVAGVLDELMEQGLDKSFDGAIGVSAGACFGMNIKSGQKGRALRYNVNLSGNPDYISFRSYLKTGNFVNAEFSYHTLPEKIDVFDNETFKNNPMDFYLVCSDALTGKPVYKLMNHIDYEMLEWLRASASLPMVCRPVFIENKILFDGGLCDPIPLKQFQKLGYERNIVVLTQPLGFEKKPTSNMWLIRFLLHRYPKVVECLRHRHEVYNQELVYIKEEAKKGNTLLIAPSEALNIGRIEMKPEKLKRVHQEGRNVCKQKLAEIKDFLGI